MKLFVYVAFNQFLNCTGQPKFDDHTPDVFSKSFERHLMTSDDSQVFQFENVSWFHLGEYDDETMEFNVLKTPLKILECNSVLETRKIKAKLLEAAKARKEEISDSIQEKVEKLDE